MGTALSKEFPDNPIIPNVLGAIYSALGKNEEAISLHAAIELNPKNAEAYNNRANVSYRYWQK